MGQIMRSRRKLAGLTQEQVAKKMGVKRATYAQYETGNRSPKNETIRKIADALGCKPYDLYPEDLKDDAIRFFMIRGLNPEFPEDDPKLVEMYGRIQRKLDAEEAENILRGEKLLKNISKDFSMLNNTGKEEAAKRVHELTSLPEYSDKFDKK